MPKGIRYAYTRHSLIDHYHHPKPEPYDEYKFFRIADPVHLMTPSRAIGTLQTTPCEDHIHIRYMKVEDSKNRKKGLSKEMTRLAAVESQEKNFGGDIRLFSFPLDRCPSTIIHHKNGLRLEDKELSNKLDEAIRLNNIGPFHQTEGRMRSTPETILNLLSLEPISQPIDSLPIGQRKAKLVTSPANKKRKRRDSDTENENPLPSKANKKGLLQAL